MNFQTAVHKFGFLVLVTLVAACPFAINRSFEKPTVSQQAFIVFSVTSALVVLLPLLFLSGQITFRPGRTVYYILLLLAMTAISALMCKNPAFSIYEMIYLVPLILYYFAFICLDIRESDLEKAAVFLSIITVPIVIYALMQNYNIDILGYEKAGVKEKRKIASFFGNPNFMASYISPILFFSLAGLVKTKNRIIRFVLGLICVSVAFCLIIAGTRAAWLGIATGLAISLVLFIKSGVIKTKYFRRGVIIAVVLAMLLVLFFMIPGVQLPFDLHERVFSMHELYGRLFLWQIGKNMFLDHPFTGVGFHRYPVELNEYALEFFSTNPRSDAYKIFAEKGKIQKFMHNEYYEILVEIGVFGLLFFLGIIISTIREGVRKINSNDADLKIMSFRIFIIGSLFVMLMDAFWGFPFQLPCSGVLFWFILAMIHKLGEREKA